MHVATMLQISDCFESINPFEEFLNAKRRERLLQYILKDITCGYFCALKDIGVCLALNVGYMWALESVTYSLSLQRWWHCPHFQRMFCHGDCMLTLK